MKFNINISEVLLSPWAGISGLIVGAIIGFLFTDVAAMIAPFGDIYLAMLQMCVLPLIITAVVNSFANLTRTGTHSNLALRMIVTFTIFMLGASFLGIFIGFVGGTGNLDEESKSVLGKLFLNIQEQIGLDEANKKGWGLVNTLIPTNFFQSLSQGRTLEVVFFAVMLGIALGLIKHPAGDNIIHFFSASFDAIFMMIKWVLHALPVGIACIVAQQIATTGFEILLALLKFVSFFSLATLVMFIFYLFVMSISTKKSPLVILTDIQESLLIAIGTQSLVAVIPQLIEDLEKNFGLSKDATQLIVPIGTTINRQGMALLYSLTGITVAQMYDITLGPLDIILMIMGMSFMAMAAIGPVFSSAPLIAYVLEPLGLPASAGIVFITASAPIITPFVVMISAHGVAAVSTLLFKGVKTST